MIWHKIRGHNLTRNHYFDWAGHYSAVHCSCGKTWVGK